MTHGHQPHMARGVCNRKLAFTTYDAAMGKLAQVPGAVRVIRGSCCGWYHITSMTEAQFAQSVAEEGCTDAFNRGMMDLSTEEFLKRWDRDHELVPQPDERREAEDGSQHSQSDAGGGRPGDASLERGSSSRLAPSPAALARRLQASSSAGR